MSIEQAAKEMALYAGWDKWDIAKTFCDTLSGNDPEDERQYWRDLAEIAFKVFQGDNNVHKT